MRIHGACPGSLSAPDSTRGEEIADLAFVEASRGLRELP